MNGGGSGRYSSNIHQRDTASTSRTQLFASATPYNPTSLVGSGSIPGSGNVSGTGSPFRTATPNTRGQYADSVMDQLESQNDAQIEGLSAKVKMLKEITVKIGEEVRDSNKLLGSMEDNFENARQKLRGTFTRMVRMAERSGVGWRAWLGLFGFIFFIFFYVWWR